jgi:hypothetical protein
LGRHETKVISAQRFFKPQAAVEMIKKEHPTLDE